MRSSEEFSKEIARLMRDPDFIRPVRSQMPRTGRRGHYDPTQPRAAAGNSNGGQWIDAGDPDTHSNDTDALPNVHMARSELLRRPIQEGVRRGIEAVLALFATLSARNTADQRAIFEFNAREYLRNPLGEFDRNNVKVLDRETVENVCRKLEDVQRRADSAANAVRASGADMSPQQSGTAIHTRVAKEINGLDNPRYRAEVSYWKMREDNVSGRPGSIRIDVLERTKGDVVCVYDLKTRESRRNILTPSRMAEIAKNVLGAYPDARRIIITEVRPRR